MTTAFPGQHWSAAFVRPCLPLPPYPGVRPCGRFVGTLHSPHKHVCWARGRCMEKHFHAVTSASLLQSLAPHLLHMLALQYDHHEHCCSGQLLDMSCISSLGKGGASTHHECWELAQWLHVLSFDTQRPAHCRGLTQKRWRCCSSSTLPGWYQTWPRRQPSPCRSCWQTSQTGVALAAATCRCSASVLKR